MLYCKLLHTLEQFKYGRARPAQVKADVAVLFRADPDLLHGFVRFMPPHLL